MKAHNTIQSTKIKNQQTKQKIEEDSPRKQNQKKQRILSKDDQELQFKMVLSKIPKKQPRFASQFISKTHNNIVLGESINLIEDNKNSQVQIGKKSSKQRVANFDETDKDQKIRQKSYNVLNVSYSPIIRKPQTKIQIRTKKKEKTKQDKQVKGQTEVSICTEQGAYQYLPQLKQNKEEEKMNSESNFPFQLQTSNQECQPYEDLSLASIINYESSKNHQKQSKGKLQSLQTFMSTTTKTNSLSSHFLEQLLTGQTIKSKKRRSCSQLDLDNIECLQNKFLNASTENQLQYQSSDEQGMNMNVKPKLKGKKDFLNQIKRFEDGIDYKREGQNIYLSKTNQQYRTYDQLPIASKKPQKEATFKFQIRRPQTTQSTIFRTSVAERLKSEFPQPAMSQNVLSPILNKKTFNKQFEDIIKSGIKKQQRQKQEKEQQNKMAVYMKRKFTGSIYAN